MFGGHRNIIYFQGMQQVRGMHPLQWRLIRILNRQFILGVDIKIIRQALMAIVMRIRC